MAREEDKSHGARKQCIEMEVELMQKWLAQFVTVLPFLITYYLKARDWIEVVTHACGRNLLSELYDQMCEPYK